MTVFPKWNFLFSFINLSFGNFSLWLWLQLICNHNQEYDRSDSVQLFSTEAFWCLKFESAWINCGAYCRGQSVRKPECDFSRTSLASVEETQPTSFLYLFSFKCKWLVYPQWNFLFSFIIVSVVNLSLWLWLQWIYNHNQEYDCPAF